MKALVHSSALLSALVMALALLTTAPAVHAQDLAAGARGGEPVVEKKVIEDDGVRIEELRVRGQTQRIVVQSKLGQARAYEVLPANGGRDLSQDKRAIGQRVWSVLSF